MLLVPREFRWQNDTVKGETSDVLTAIGRSRLREVGRAVGEKFILCKEFICNKEETARPRNGLGCRMPVGTVGYGAIFDINININIAWSDFGSE